MMRGRAHPFPGRISLAIILAIARVISAGAAETEATFSIAPPPAWVAADAGEPLRAPATGGNDAEVFLLLEYQVNVASEEHFSRFVKEVRTAEGVQQGSSVLVVYDPSYQRLVFHHIRVIRGGVATSRLSRESVQLLRREPNLESQVLDGSLTASVVLQDVRPGDRIDVAYTVRGGNPAFGRRYVDEFACGWYVPVANARVRIRCPASRPLRFKMYGGATDPARSVESGAVEYRWSVSDTRPVLEEDQTPPWHIAAPWVQVSEFSSWGEVSRWALALYPPAKLPEELERLATAWRTQHAAPADRARAAVDWVQQNIRYVGIELGIGSYRPSPPATVVARRFGDCKDQSYLLCTLLRRLGLEATPVLVNTGARGLVADMLPSPFAFNHVITRLDIGGRVVFVDPTRAYQRGPVQNRFMPDYGQGLVVADGQEALMLFGSPQGVAPEVEVVERIRVAGQGEPATLDVETTGRGGAADEMREQFAAGRLEELASSYLNYYAARYPRIESAGDLGFTDDAEGNVFRTTEKYRLPEFWVPQSDGSWFQGEVFADAVYSTIPRPQTTLRTTPLLVDFPRRVLQRMEIELPEAWPGDSQASTFSNAAFDLRVERTHAGRTITITFDYRARAQEVAAADMQSYSKAILDLDDELGYQFTWAKAALTEGGRPNATVLAVGSVSLALLLAAAVLVYRRVASPAGDVPAPVLDGVDAGLQGLGGWLVPVAAGLLGRPILSVISLVQLAPSLSEGSWQELASPSGAFYHALWAPFLLFELVANLAMAVACILLFILFLQRRRAFPRAFIILLVGQVVILFVDLALGGIVSGGRLGSSDDSLRQAVSTLVPSIGWIVYTLRSRRVRLTFTR